MGREHWVPSCHQHLCSEHFTPASFQWRWGVRYLRPDAVPSIFSQAPPTKVLKQCRSVEKPVAPPLQESAPQTPDSSIPASGSVHLVVLGPPPGGPEAAATVLLPLTSSGRHSEASTPQDCLGLGAMLGVLQRRVWRLQRRHERHQAQLRALEELVWQLHWEGLLARLRCSLPGLLPGPEESRAFTIVCGRPDIAVIVAQGSAPPTLDTKLEPSGHLDPSP
ncbi:THAP domain-containing protein 8 isoform X2 [Dasypus novemcinctus]|nr:THAP domain-containing protein 8 isoform X2 [Dasypus novemcinctus]XP_058135266.1 THAP domain-containing protein 8 isoform X2 [Dasypus novemcinctus]XP_058135267.1 THAP domain-containing protein 8 isoform X2 [Dasypus novemcinctus]XP_058135268.1 THAP domain-containing protein 8 isoform X2 [Dasypus novemcinctus]XP_058135269.1 THAP domain-containing protein 8 isoform X2 [Dasypus novemcinctus]XP_058135270.1 THAP domain-containing protein 8 isoform X2 [Dasypus novemcinctus]XP_058135271.1 THAP dom